LDSSPAVARIWYARNADRNANSDAGWILDAIENKDHRPNSGARPTTRPISQAPTPAGLRLDIADVKHALKALMVRSVGLTRESEKLEEAAEQVDFWSRYALGQVFVDPDGWVLQNMLTLARVMIDAALTRTESRGVHFRQDFPVTTDAWRRHIRYTLEESS